MSAAGPTTAGALPIVLRCDAAIARRARYTFDTMLQAAGIPVEWVDAPPSSGPWLLYAVQPPELARPEGMLFVVHDPNAWQMLGSATPPARATVVDGTAVVSPAPGPGIDPRRDVGFDLAANAFYFLASWAERKGPRDGSTRQLYASSEFARLGIPQDIVDRYLALLVERLHTLCVRIGAPTWPPLDWPEGRSFAVVLSHDVDFLPVQRLDNLLQAAKTVLRHLLRQRDPGDAWRAARGWVAAVARGRDPYGCVPEIIAHEHALGLRSSFQVAVGHRHPNDVNYRIEDDRVRDYLRVILDAGFDLCLHGSYRSTENTQWYVDEVELLGLRLARPLGSRQHFLSFDYDTLFIAQERAGIEYDMSIGYPDRPGPRAGFSYPYFPYDLRADRPYRVLQIGLQLMDVTLRGYMGLRPDAARPVIDGYLADLLAKRGCASTVWHPIVFGGARDPGYDRLYYDMAVHVGAIGGLATDGRTINAFWRERACRYASFA